MEAPVYTTQGEEQGARAALPEAVFDGTVNEHALHQVVTAILAHRRQGTAATKTRGAVRGGGRKPWRQKGTGRARAGTIRSPLWRGGSVVFGPHPRSYDVRVPRKVKRLAIRSALNARALEGRVAVVDALELEAPRTKEIAGLIKGIGVEGRNVLLLTDGNKPEVYLSGRNIPGLMVCRWGEASAYDILWSDLVLIEASALAGNVATEGDEA